MTTATMTDQPGTEIVQRTPVEDLVAKVRGEGTAGQIQAALPTTVTLQRFTRATVTALMQNPDLAGADETSFFQSLVKCAMDGLLPDGREAALVLYGNKVNYLPMIGGVRKIAAQYGWTIRTHAIYENDDFDVDLGTGRVTHRPPRVGDDRGQLRGAWAIAHHRDGREAIVEVMDKTQIAQAKAIAKTKQVWDKWPAQMHEKTVGHRIAKKLPLDPLDSERLSRVIDAVEMDGAQAAQMLYGPSAAFGELAAGVDAETGEIHEVPSQGVPQPSTEQAPGDQGAAHAGGGTPAPPGTAVSTLLDEEALMLAAEAATFVPTSGRYAEGGEQGPFDLAAILDLGDEGRKYLAMLLRQLSDGPWRDAVEAFARVQMPDEYAAAIERRAV